MKKQLRILALLAVVLLAATGCTSTTTATPTTAPTQAATDAPTETTAPDATAAAGTEVFTVDELKTYNGKDGAKAYVAVDGVVYDVTDVAEWADGVHNGMEAGEDLTEAIKTQSPHGVSVLEGLTVVGTLK